MRYSRNTFLYTENMFSNPTFTPNGSYLSTIQVASVLLYMSVLHCQISLTVSRLFCWLYSLKHKKGHYIFCDISITLLFSPEQNMLKLRRFSERSV